LETYIEDPLKWEPGDPGLSFTNNRMMYVFGLEPEYWKNEAALRR
jgi:hypothetical protein